MSARRAPGRQSRAGRGPRPPGLSARTPSPTSGVDLYGKNGQRKGYVRERLELLETKEPRQDKTRPHRAHARDRLDGRHAPSRAEPLELLEESPRSPCDDG